MLAYLLLSSAHLCSASVLASGIEMEWAVLQVGREFGR